MIEEGTTAPAFELPGIVNGERRRVALSEYLGEDVVVLGFFPGAFNRACDGESDLDQLDLFTMQPDVTVLAVGPDTVAANETFAEEYGLTIPLLSDTTLAVATEYDLAYEDDLGQHRIARAAFVLDLDGEVVYAWSSRDPGALVDVEAIKEALAETGGDDTALSRYRQGHAHFLEGRRALTSATEAYSSSEWTVAQSEFELARDEFEAADGQFTSAVRFVDDEIQQAHYEAATETASALWQAAEWLGRSAGEFASGAGAAGDGLRADAQRPLEIASTWPDPRDPEEWPPEEPPERLEPAGDRRASPIGTTGEDPPALDIDLDAGGLDEPGRGTTGDDVAHQRPPAGEGGDASAGGVPAAEAGEIDVEDDIDDRELAEIEAEIAASGPEDPREVGRAREGDTVAGDSPGTDSGAGEQLDVATPEPELGSDGGDSAVEGDAHGPETAQEPEETSLEDPEPLAEMDPESTTLDDIPSESDLAEDASEE